MQNHVQKTQSRDEKSPEGALGEATRREVNMYALETTKNEIENGYRDLTRLLNGGQALHAVQAALGLVKVDVEQLWRFLKNYASTEINHRDTNHILVLDALHTSWLHDPTNTNFIVHAVATLANATKNRSESILKFFK